MGAATDSGVRGFGPGALQFFDELADDNSREFWHANLEVFEREVKEPMAAILESLPPPYDAFRVFRMNRDVRFTKDKSSYRTQHGAVMRIDGTECYVHLDAAGFLAACGTYQMERDQLARYRAAVDDGRTGKALERILADLEGRASVSSMGAEPLKTAPRGFSTDHPRIELLRRKSLIAHHELTGPTLADGAAVRTFVLDLFEAAGPLTRWLRKNIGETTEQTGPGRSLD